MEKNNEIMYMNKECIVEGGVVVNESSLDKQRARGSLTVRQASWYSEAFVNEENIANAARTHDSIESVRAQRGASCE